MKVYFGNSLGCTLWAIALTIFFFFTAGIVLKLLLTTPLGLILLGVLIFTYFKNRQRIKSFGNGGGFYWTNGGEGQPYGNGYDQTYHDQERYTNISGQPEEPSIRQQYEEPSVNDGEIKIDRSAYRDVEDAEFVELKDSHKN